MGRINWKDVQDATFPAGSAAPQTITKSSDGVLECYGTSLPANGTGGYAPGCRFIHVDGAADEVLYVNEGSKISCDFHKADRVPSAYHTTSGRGPSPGIWGDCPVLEMMLNPGKGWIHFYDFQNGPEIAAATAVSSATACGYTVYSEANATATQQTDAPEGELLLEVNGADDIDIALGYSEKAGCIKIAASQPKAFWFEARVKMATVGDNKTGMFIGLHDEGCFVADGILADDGAMTSDDYLGFLWPSSDNDTIDTVCELAAGAMLQIQDTVAVPVNDTYIKLGMKLIEGETNVRFYVNDVETSTTVAVTNAKFPADQELQPVLALRSAAADSPAGGASIDWWRFAQLY